MTPFDLPPSITSSDLEGLQRLKQKTDAYVQEVFDWVAPLQQHHVLGLLYDFRGRIETAITLLEKKS
jgi:uncharacterized protein YrrD